MRVRIVRRLQQLHPDVSGSRLKRAVLEGQVTVDGEVVDDPGAIVADGAAVIWDPNRKIRRRVDTSLEVLYEDDDAVAVVKPAGLLTHPTEANELDTLLSRVSLWAKRRYGANRRSYVAVVHRLDKETSGVLVFARSSRGLHDLQAQLRNHTMDRRYVAVIEGDIFGDAGTFDQELVEDRGDRRRGVARPGTKGTRAVTEWKVVERFGLATLVEVRLKPAAPTRSASTSPTPGTRSSAIRCTATRAARRFRSPSPPSAARRAPRLADARGRVGAGGSGPTRRLRAAARCAARAPEAAP